MRLKSELHAIIGVCAALVFLVVGATAWWEVRRVHLLEVEALGRTLALNVSRSCARAVGQDPPSAPGLRYLIDSSREGDARVVAAAVFDSQGRCLERVGATSRETTGPEDDPLLRRVLALPADLPTEQVVETVRGEEHDRYGPHGEPLLEFATPIADAEGRSAGVLVLSLVREPAGIGYARPVTFVVFSASVLIGLVWLILYKMLDQRILTPILQLSRGIERVRAGDLSARVELARQDEIGVLTRSFNDLIGILVERDSLQARLAEANRLAEAHARLHEAHVQLKRAQEQLILNEKHASLGRLVHGLNHELNNPLSAAQNMIPPLLSALEGLRSSLQPPPPPPPPREDQALLHSAASADALDPVALDPSALDPSALDPSALDPVALDLGGSDAAELVVQGPAPGPPAGDRDEGQTPAAPLPGEPATAGPGGSPAGGSGAALSASALEEVDEHLQDLGSAAEVIARSVKRAINIMRDLGQFSKLGQADLQEVELRAMVEEAITACERELGPDGRVAVLLDLPEPEGRPLRLKAFPSLLLQVFVNLFVNAGQAIRGPGKVKVAARLIGNGRVRIDVEDTGPGIPKENLGKIFEPFFTTKEQGQGSGLGLSICLGVIEKHGGTLVAKKQRRGAHFVIELPLEPVVPTGDPWTSSPLLAAPGASASGITTVAVPPG